MTAPSNRFGLVGHPLDYSLSPQVHKALFGQAGYAGSLMLYDTPPDELAGFFATQASHLGGFSVAMPYTRTIGSYLDTMSPDAQACGAANAITWSEDGLCGHNTLFWGLLNALVLEGFDPRGKRVLLLGAGGAARSAAYALQRAGARVFVHARNAEKLKSFCSKNGCQAFHMRRDSGRIHAVINASAAGMYPFEGYAPFELSKLDHLEWVYDMVYHPAETALVRQADGLRVPAKGGLSTLVCSAASTQTLWHDVAFQDRQKRQVTLQMLGALAKKRLYQLYSRQNIAIFGFMAAGKSMIAAALSDLCQMQFLDMDEQMEQQIGMPLQEFVSKNGKEAYEKLQDNAARMLIGIENTVIACNSNFMLHPERAEFAKRNCLAVLLDTSFPLLVHRLQADRTRLRGGNFLPRLKALYSSSYSDYRAAADLIFVPQNIDAPENAKLLAKRI